MRLVLILIALAAIGALMALGAAYRWRDRRASRSRDPSDFRYRLLTQALAESRLAISET